MAAYVSDPCPSDWLCHISARSYEETSHVFSTSWDMRLAKKDHIANDTNRDSSDREDEAMLKTIGQVCYYKTLCTGLVNFTCKRSREKEMRVNIQSL